MYHAGQKQLVSSDDHRCCDIGLVRNPTPTIGQIGYKLTKLFVLIAFGAFTNIFLHAIKS